MKPLPGPKVFVRRLLAGLAVGASIVLISLAVGMVGYRYYEGLAWLDAFVSASMILSGMGPTFAPVTEGGKLFSGIYALYSGFAVLAVAGVVFAPIIHRFLHRFHLEAEDDP